MNFCKWKAKPKRVRYDYLDARNEAKRVAWDGLEEAAVAGGSKQTKPTAPRVRYEGPREAKRVAWNGLPGDHEHTAKRVGFQGLRLESQDL
ncbi:hypothetical protein BHYA_0045g00190 [Botrytis hyacinthi]|uniref:Uncharacterized protein n=1 Tax=Botrytis hyacinthi TaxID=278943 RepID=A0A4Z1GT24_9HELO|nr:hypothetical protein BHYA_0045g00190 [Botrytis hyacinthi]